MGFNTWVNDGNLDTILSDAGFRDDSQRATGFISGTPASSIRVNSALRQANLVACALMDAIGITTDYTADSLVTARDTLSSHIKTELNTKLEYVKLSGSSEITGSLTPKTTNTTDLGNSNRIWKGVYCDDVYYGGSQSLKDKMVELQAHTIDSFSYSEAVTQNSQTIGRCTIDIKRVDFQYTMQLKLEIYSGSTLSVPAGQTRGLIDIYTPLKPDFETSIVMFDDTARLHQFYFSIKYTMPSASEGSFIIDNTGNAQYSASIQAGTYIGRIVYLKA